MAWYDDCKSRDNVEGNLAGFPVTSILAFNQLTAIRADISEYSALSENYSEVGSDNRDSGRAHELENILYLHLNTQEDNLALNNWNEVWYGVTTGDWEGSAFSAVKVRELTDAYKEILSR